MITLTTADAAGLAWAQEIVTTEHYLHAQVDPRCSPVAYLVHYHDARDVRPDPVHMRAATGQPPVGILIFGRPEATRCYDGALTYGSLADVQAGRAQYDRWEVLNLARVCFSPVVQAGGRLHGPDHGIPGYTDRRGVWRSTLVSWAIGQALARIGFDYLTARPPVDCQYPYQMRAVLSYCDTRLHKGTIYRAAGFELARTNERGIQTWYTPAVAPLTAEQDVHVRRLAERSPRSQRIRAARMQERMAL